MLKRNLLSHVHYSTICGQDVESIVCGMDGWLKKHSAIYTVECYVRGSLSFTPEEHMVLRIINRSQKDRFHMFRVQLKKLI